ncbi:MAG: hypothetical protein CMJ81_03515 [Planctomycetaceae bacterium]|nr:hypothetical protein [Planctomycetaceae bacterium]
MLFLIPFCAGNNLVVLCGVSPHSTQQQVIGLADRRGIFRERCQLASDPLYQTRPPPDAEKGAPDESCSSLYKSRLAMFGHPEGKRFTVNKKPG